MPAETHRQAGFMGLVVAFKKTGHMPKASGGEPLSTETQAKVRKAAGSLTVAQAVDFLRTRTRSKG